MVPKPYSSLYLVYLPGHCCENANKDEVNSPNILSNNNYRNFDKKYSVKYILAHNMRQGKNSHCAVKKK